MNAIASSLNLTDSWRQVSDCIVPPDTAPPEVTHASSDASLTTVWHALFSQRPRPLLLPADNRLAQRSAVKFFLPKLWRQGYARARLYAHEWLGEYAQLPRFELPTTYVATLASTLADNVALTETPQLAFLIGTPGPYQKAAMLVMSRAGKPLALVKLALGSGANEMVQAEAAWLQRLNSYALIQRCLPQLLQCGRTRNGGQYLAQSIIAGRADPGDFTVAHADFLIRLGAVDCRVTAFIDASIHTTMQSNWLRLLPALTASQTASMQAAWQECTQRLADWTGPFVISHGDFASWNIRVLEQHITVFDWEYAVSGAPPVFDLLHFYLIAAAVSGQSLDIRDLKRALAAAQTFLQASYPDHQWPANVIAAMGLAYLLHTLFFYGASCGQMVETHPVVRSYYYLIKERALWLP